MATNSDAPPFAGLKVVDVASWIAGPVAATMLADYGADVVKVEMPGVGDGYRALAAAPGMPVSEINYMWMMDARNKRSVTLNLKDPRGKAILLRLVENCDVYVTNQPMPMRRALGLTFRRPRADQSKDDLCLVDRIRRGGSRARPRRIRPRCVLGSHRPDGPGSNGRRRAGAIVTGNGRSPERGRAVCIDRHGAVSRERTGAAARSTPRCSRTDFGRRDAWRKQSWPARIFPAGAVRPVWR